MDSQVLLRSKSHSTQGAAGFITPVLILAALFLFAWAYQHGQAKERADQIEAVNCVGFDCYGVRD